MGLLPAAQGEELEIDCFGEACASEAGLDMDLGEALDVDFSGDPVGALFVTGLRKGVDRAGFFLPACGGGDVVTGFDTFRVGDVCFPLASPRGAVAEVFIGAFEGVLEVVGFFESDRGGEAAAVFVEIALGGEAGGGVVFIITGCFPRRAVAVATGLVEEGAEAPARVFLTVNGVA